ncbi:MAG: PAC2 family protein [Candidatus Methanoplasma sp.]|nr:PAC2 family protein [Candidatus Methanoplasma sp.]
MRYDDATYENPTALVGLPSIGLVGSILSSFIVREMSMSVIAGITSPDLPPYCMIQGGTPYPPIRIYGCTRDKTDETGGDLVIVTSEIAPKPEQCYALAVAIMGVLRDLGVSMAICLEGVPSYEGGDSMVACGSSKRMHDEIDRLGLRNLGEGLVRGTTGIMLYEGAHSGMDVMSILCPANPALPDPRAAARLLEPLSKILPELKMDVNPLYKEAEDIDLRMKSQEAYANRENTDLRQLYG